MEHDQFEFGFVMDSLNDNDDKEHWIDEGYNSYWNGYGIWEKYEIVTIELDCNNWTVSDFQGKEKIQRNNIKPMYPIILHYCVVEKDKEEVQKDKIEPINIII